MTTTPDAASQAQGALSALLQEDRRYPPADSCVAQANISDPAIYERARRDPEALWAEQAQGIDWISPTRPSWNGTYRGRSGLSEAS